MEVLIQELSMFVAPLVASAGVVVLVVFLMGLITLKKWITYLTVLFIGVLVFLGAIVYVNSIEPEEITSDLLHPYRFIVWIFQQFGKGLIPAMESIDMLFNQ